MGHPQIDRSSQIQEPPTKGKMDSRIGDAPTDREPPRLAVRRRRQTRVLSRGLYPRLPDWKRHVADFDLSGRKTIPVLTAITARFNQLFKKRRLGAQDLK